MSKKKKPVRQRTAAPTGENHIRNHDMNGGWNNWLKILGDTPIKPVFVYGANEPHGRVPVEIAGIDIDPPEHWPSEKRRLSALIERTLMRHPHLKHLSVLPMDSLRLLVRPINRGAASLIPA